MIPYPMSCYQPFIPSIKAERVKTIAKAYKYIKHFLGKEFKITLNRDETKIIIRRK